MRAPTSEGMARSVLEPSQLRGEQKVGHLRLLPAESANFIQSAIHTQHVLAASCRLGTQGVEPCAVYCAVILCSVLPSTLPIVLTIVLLLVYCVLCSADAQEQLTVHLFYKQPSRNHCVARRAIRLRIQMAHKVAHSQRVQLL